MILHPHFVLLSWNNLIILLSRNITWNHSINNCRHDRSEKWLVTTCKVHRISAPSVIQGIIMLSTVVLFELLSVGNLGLPFSFLKNMTPVWELLRLTISEYFFPKKWLVSVATPILEMSKSLLLNVQHPFHLVSDFLSHWKNGHQVTSYHWKYSLSLFRHVIS